MLRLTGATTDTELIVINPEPHPGALPDWPHVFRA
jgi:hypothetical protein